MSVAESSFKLTMRVAQASENLVKSLLRDGIVDTATRASLRVRWAWHEWRLGIQTSGSIDGQELQHDRNSFGYQPLPPEVLHAAMRHLSVRPGEDVFLDLGCGKGRAVLFAANYPFRRVIGVELSRELSDAAIENVRKARHAAKCPELEIVCADAREYTIPDDVTGILLFNPFDEPILSVVMENIRASLTRRPRKLVVVYAIPNCRRDPLTELPWLVLKQKAGPSLAHWLRLAIYETAPSVESRSETGESSSQESVA